MSQGEVFVPIRGENKELKQALDGSSFAMAAFGGASVAVFTKILDVAMQFVSELASIPGKLWDLYSVQEMAVARLSAVVEANGNAAGFTSQQLQDMASSLQDVTRFGDEAILSNMTLFSQMQNIRGDNFKRAAELSLDMAEAMGGDATSGAQSLGRALEDPVRGMMMLRRANIIFSQSEQDAIKQMVAMNDIAGAQTLILDKVESRVGGVAEKMAGTLTGRFESMQNRMGDMGEVLFTIFVPALEAAMPALQGIINFLENVTDVITSGTIPGVTQFSEFITGPLSDAFTWVVKIGVGAFTILQLAIENWKNVTLILINQWLLSQVQQFETMRWILQEVIPAVLIWFANNWVKIFTDMTNFQNTVMKNMFTNLVDFIKAVPQLLKGNFEDFKFTSLLKGFEMTLDELPDIAARKKGAIEKGLEDNIATLAEPMAKAFGLRFAENMSSFMGLFEKKARKDMDEITPELPVSDVYEAMSGGPKATKAAKAKAEKEKGQMSASFESLSSLSARISQAAAVDQTAKRAERQRELHLAKLDELRTAVMTVAGKLEVAGAGILKGLPSLGALVDTGT